MGISGGKGARIAVLDTGVAFRTWRSFRQDPELAAAHFAAPYDFVAHNRYPVDRNGHGTFIASEIAEATNNHTGLTGLAYGATIIPVRVLNAEGWGSAATIARGVRYAVAHGADVIDLSLEFDPRTINSPADIPQLASAIRYAVRKDVVVVAAAGDDSSEEVSYPARLPGVIAVGATTSDRCLAGYSNYGVGLTLVAPGGGPDTRLSGDSACQPSRRLPPIYQMTLYGWRLGRFGYPTYFEGTSMAAAEVAGAAGLVVASFRGKRPAVRTVRAILDSSATRMGYAGRLHGLYGAGLLDAGAAVALAAKCEQTPARCPTLGIR